MNIVEKWIKKRKIGIMTCVFLAIIIVFISGCITTETVCNKPYYEYKTGECCLDENDNKICDKDEVEKEHNVGGESKKEEPVGEQPKKENAIEEKPTCNKPYYEYKTGECCLDENDNEVCDKDEITPPPIPEPSGKNITVNVSKVIDGDTIELKTGERVRLLGINTPEMGQPCYEEATNRLKELIEGKQIRLESDVVDKDQYERLLRHVFIDNTFVNLVMVREGYAHVYIVQPNVNYENEMYDAQTSAIHEGGCMWKKPTTEDGENICDNRCIGIDYFHWNAEGNDCDNLNDEYVRFKNNCSYSCDMTGWTIKDESSRDPYTFPSFVLESEAMVTLYTGCGSNTDVELYWCSSGNSCNAVWNNNGKDTLYLRNSKGNLVLSHTYQVY